MKKQVKIALKKDEQTLIVPGDNYSKVPFSYKLEKVTDELVSKDIDELFNYAFAIENGEFYKEDLKKMLNREVSDFDMDLFKKIILYCIYRKSVHKCWKDCKNAYPSKCLKVFDLPKENIEKYDFVKYGFQVIENDEIERFVVINCKNYCYKPDINRIKNSTRIKK